MKERPILFNGAMVGAILDGSKTQTRRIVKPQPVNGWDFEAPPVLGRITSPHPKKGRFGAFVRRGLQTDFPQYDLIPCPYGQPGDQLWVRETWAQPTTLDPGPTIYRADYPDCVPADYINIPPADEVVWRPSIHMPKALSRITLEITGVRVERLQDISEDDCRAEGCHGGHGSIPGYAYNATPSEHFQYIWKSTGGNWDANPWVWVPEFRRITP